MLSYPLSASISFRTSTVWCFLVAAIAFASPVSGQSVFVIPNQPWIDTGISVTADEELTITATGDMDWNTNNTCPAGQSCTVGPDGQNPGEPCPVKAVLAPQFACYSLIGRIGNEPSSAPFEVGSSFSTLSAPASGELYLSVNDGYFADNTLGWTASVTIGNCTQFWDVDASKLSAGIHVDPRLTWDAEPDLLTGTPSLYVFAGDHFKWWPDPRRYGFVLDADPAITLKPGANSSLAGNLVYVQNLYRWRGTATYGDGVDEYPAAISPGVNLQTLAVLDATCIGCYTPINFIWQFTDSPMIHVPLFDADLHRRRLKKINYTKGFKTYMGCVVNNHIHTLAILPWHVLYSGSVFVQFRRDAVFTQDPGSGVYFDEPLTTLPLPQPVTGAPLANCVVGFQNFPPAPPFNINPSPDCHPLQ